MKLPIKLNRAGWPPPFSRLSFSFHDPRPLTRPDLSTLTPAEFSKAISTLQFGVTFKTTYPGRHKHSDRYVADLYRGSKPVILDVGASDGSTSLDLIERLGADFSRYLVTDLNIATLYSCNDRGTVFFLDRNGRCALRASRRFIVYAEIHGAIFPLSWLAKRLVSGSRDLDDWRELLLIQPELAKLARRDSRISIMPYDVFLPWTDARPDLIKVANLLNPKYFTAEQIKEAVHVQCFNLGNGGRLLLVSEDDDTEKFSVFRKTPDGMRLEHTHAGGAKAASYVQIASGSVSRLVTTSATNA